MTITMFNKLKAVIERRFPERRVFLRSDTETRFIRLSPIAQVTSLLGGTALVSWAIVATAILLMDSIGSGNVRDQARREQSIYETRLNALSSERDSRAEEALAAQERFNLALSQISQMQSSLLASEDQRKELETGIEVIQRTLRRTMNERDDALVKADTLSAELEGTTGSVRTDSGRIQDIESTVDFLTSALELTAGERDEIADTASEAQASVEELLLQARLAQERNDRIFQQLEDAVSISLAPLDEMFRAAGLPTDRIIEQIRRGYSGQGGPLTPLSFSTRGEPPSAESLRANAILSEMDRVNIYRIAAQKTPFAIPVKSAFRYTSGFGPRWGRMHNGTDFAGASGTPIYSTADGVVTHAGWSSGYGRLVKIQHEFGIETRYAHMSAVRVEVGQRVSRGDRIGDMGNSGRSTGTHLHYEVRVDGNPVNPMNYIRAANNVF
ncbi:MULTISPECIES: M23 family metallopeptidase [Pseudohalocynthiibacter]|nr:MULTISPECIES: M23 family metallopeptidase [Pseudohalocynthiibacter]